MIFNYIKLVTIVCLVAWGCKTEREGVEFTLTVTTETRPQNKLFVFYYLSHEFAFTDYFFTNESIAFHG